ncbi:hypothetical protein BS47DRAFT_1340430, partial [Hydnum rufescens UP504]
CPWLCVHGCVSMAVHPWLCIHGSVLCIPRPSSSLTQAMTRWMRKHWSCRAQSFPWVDRDSRGLP